MKVVSTPFRRGPAGPANVRITKTTVTVIMDKGGEQFQFPTKEADLPKGITSGKWSVSISSDLSKLQGIRPLDGAFVCRFKNMVAQKGQPPLPKRDQRPGTKKDGTTFPKDLLKFTAIVEIADGQLAGVQIPVSLVYKNLLTTSGFSSGPENLVVVQGGDRDMQLLTEFLVHTGAMDSELPFSDNILPALETSIKNRKKKFMMWLANGWPTKIDSVPDLGKKVKRNGK